MYLPLLRNVHVPVVGVFAVLTLFACGSETHKSGSNDDDLAARYTAKLRECGALGEGESDHLWTFDARARCSLEKCLLPARCDAFFEVTCNPGDSDYSTSPSFYLLECFDKCTRDTAFQCGGGEWVSAGGECDGNEDCENGSDEANCEGKRFACGDGSFTRFDLVCDGFTECDNGADEENCEMFRCDSGEEVVIAERCNHEPMCDDESDEAGCASYCPE
jgi:hypothetical protein